MKRQLVTTILASILLMTACSDQPANNSTHSTATQTKVTDTASLIRAAKSVTKDVKSYESTYKNDIQKGKDTSIVDFSLIKDAKDNQKVSIKNNTENATFYVYNKKTILKQNDEWIDASTYVGTQMISQTEPLLYPSQFKLIEQLKNAEYKSENGYTLTETFDDYNKYKELFANTKDNEKVITELEKAYPEISGTITVHFKENKQLDIITNKLTLKNDQTTVTNNAVTTFNKINNAKLDIPEEVKKAQQPAK
ncbi:hypothetical protein [Macrococcus lamae]|uniref:Lipoprotein n=1 Tax=Macrococcus lamae TaxID=198484 RepID=A0A4R6BTB1_9STAP|nr:hypothetical protein [Macrococcus lamae]TDM07701.1 hypothetical protein ERX29_08135 [Macrococcus lamae]